MKKKKFILGIIFTIMAATTISCIEHNDKENNSNNSPQNSGESDYGNKAPTYNKTREDIEAASDTVTVDKRVPKDPVEIKSKGNAASK